MSFGTARGLAPVPPEKGSFPLDHKGACKHGMVEFLACLKENKNAHYICKDISKSYLQCRMEKGLMAERRFG